MIQTVLLHQLIVGSMLYQPSIVKDEDLVCIYNCTEAVGDHNNRLTFHQFGNRLFEPGLHSPDQGMLLPRQAE